MIVNSNNFNQPAFGAYFSKSSIPALNDLTQWRYCGKETEKLADEFKALPNQEIEVEYGELPDSLIVTNKDNGKKIGLKAESLNYLLEKILKESENFIDNSKRKVDNDSETKCCNKIVEKLTTQDNNIWD